MLVSIPRFCASSIMPLTWVLKSTIRTHVLNALLLTFPLALDIQIYVDGNVKDVCKRP